MPRRRALFALLGIFVLFASACADAQARRGSVALASSRSPDIVLILSDDQRWDTLWAMPNVRSLIGKHGTTFTNALVSNASCCPSRTTILTGDYSHTTGVYTNKNGQPFGGFHSFDDGTTIATALQGKGYRTALIGKYLNGYEGTYIPAGWDRWFATYEAGGYYDYTASDDGDVRRFGHRPIDYGTDVVTRRAMSFINSTSAGKPLFLYFAPHAPHEPATPAPRDRHAFEDLAPLQSPSVGERDMSDKPEFMRALGFPAAERAKVEKFRRAQLASLRSLDRDVGRIVRALRRSGRLSNTMLVFASDNGMQWGEHRWTTKGVAYEESIRVPLVIRYDAMANQVRRDSHLVGNLDLAPTFASVADVDIGDTDGRSILPLIAGARVDWRKDLLLEHLNLGKGGVPTFCGVRAKGAVLVRYGTGETELYDLRRDPFELRNVAGDAVYRGLKAKLLSRLEVLCSPPPPGMTL